MIVEEKIKKVLFLTLCFIFFIIPFGPSGQLDVNYLDLSFKVTHFLYLVFFIFGFTHIFLNKKKLYFLTLKR